MPNIQNIPTTQYIGPKIVPHFADPAAWDITREYDALSIVTDGGNTYWAKYNVPAGINISNTDYWFLSAYPDSQIQAYREEVLAYAHEVEAYDARITAAQTDATTANTILTGFSTSNKVKPYIDNEISDVESYVDNAIEEMQEVIEENPFLSLTEAVFIGDSFTSAYYLIQNGATEKDRWCYPVAKALNVNPHIYAERGAGYTRQSPASEGGHNFRGMLDVASADTSFDNDAVKYVFVYGGLNDIDHENANTAFSTNFPSFCNLAHSTFKNAIIVVCGINAWPEGLSFYEYTSGSNHYMRGQIFYEQYMKSQNAFFDNHCIFISMVGALGFKASYYYDDNRHPNVRGNDVIASWILSAMLGSPDVHSTSTTLNKRSDPNTTFGSFIVHFSPGQIEVFAQVPTAGDSDYICDGFEIMKDAAIDLRGVSMVTESSGDVLVGYLGARDNETSPYGYIHTVNHGYFRFVRVF